MCISFHSTCPWHTVVYINTTNGVITVLVDRPFPHCCATFCDAIPRGMRPPPACLRSDTRALTSAHTARNAQPKKLERSHNKTKATHAKNSERTGRTDKYHLSFHAARMHCNSTTSSKSLNSLNYAPDMRNARSEAPFARRPLAKT